MTRDGKMDVHLDVSRSGYAGRLEVIEGPTGRRQRSDAEKARIAAEALVPEASVAAVARRHGVTRWQVYDWRRRLRDGRQALPGSAASAPAFAALVVEEATHSPPCACRHRDRGGRYHHPGWSGCRHRATVAGHPRGTTGGRDMIAADGHLRVYVATRPVDFRKGHDGLAALVQSMLGQNPFGGAVFVLRSKRADRIKVLAWDGAGLVLVYKHLEGGTFVWPQVQGGVMRMSPVHMWTLRFLRGGMTAWVPCPSSHSRKAWLS